MRWTIISEDGGASWYAKEWKGDESTGGYKVASNLSASLLNKIDSMLNFVKQEAGFKPTSEFIECIIRPKGAPENEGQRSSRCLVHLNFRDSKIHKDCRRDDQVFIVTNQEYDSLTFE